MAIGINIGTDILNEIKFGRFKFRKDINSKQFSRIKLTATNKVEVEFYDPPPKVNKFQSYRLSYFLDNIIEECLIKPLSKEDRVRLKYSLIVGVNNKCSTQITIPKL